MGELVDNRKVEPYIVHYVCDEPGCKHHQKRDHSVPMQMDPPAFGYKCAAGHVAYLTDNYPAVRYRYVSE